MSSEPALAIDLHGVTIEAHGDAEALAGLGVLFGAFVRPAVAAAQVQVRLSRGRPDLSPLGRRRASQVLERGAVYVDGGITWIDHRGAALSRYDHRAERGSVVAEEVADLVELGYLMIQSRAGMLLEGRGLLRIHGLGVRAGERAAVVLLPSGGGKSRLALACLAHPEVSLLSDDVILVDRRGRGHPFPMPIGVSEPALGERLGRVHRFARRHHPLKYVVDIGDLLPRHTRGPVAITELVLAHRVSAPPVALERVPRRRLAPGLWRDMVVGLGLPQVLELVARRGAADLVRLAPAAAHRSAVASVLLARSRCWELEIADPDTAAARLVAMLRDD